MFENERVISRSIAYKLHTLESNHVDMTPGECAVYIQEVINATTNLLNSLSYQKDNMLDFQADFDAGHEQERQAMERANVGEAGNPAPVINWGEVSGYRTFNLMKGC